MSPTYLPQPPNKDAIFIGNSHENSRQRSWEQSLPSWLSQTSWIAMLMCMGIIISPSDPTSGLPFDANYQKAVKNL